MNREEKVLSNAIYECDVGIESYKRLLKREDAKGLHDNFRKSIEEQEILKKCLTRELKLLQIPQRTIETLAVNDFIVFEDTRHISLKMTQKIEDDFHLERLKYLIKENFIKVYEEETIPHEFLELWGEIND